MTVQVGLCGVGETEYVRGTPKSSLQLGVQAARAACADAGIDPCAIDGVIPSYGSTAEDFAVALGISDLRFHANLAIGGASAVSAVSLAAQVVRAGYASRVLIVGGSAQYSGGRRLSDASGAAMNLVWPSQAIRTHIEFPSGMSVPMQW